MLICFLFVYLRNKMIVNHLLIGRSMGKYNITEKKEKEAAYRSLVSPKMMDEMQEKILNIIVMQKKYRDKD